MENTNTFIIVLLLMTLLAGVAYGVWQYVRTQRAKRNNTHSAMTKGTPFER